MHALRRIVDDAYTWRDLRRWRRERARLQRRALDGAPVPPTPPGQHLQRERSPHLVVVAQALEGSPDWAAGQGTFTFEIAQCAREQGVAGVSVFAVREGESVDSWHSRLEALLLDVGATHLIAQVELDPGGDPHSWHWDALWARLLRSWDGVLLGVLFDSSFRWILAKADLLGRMSERFVLVDICMPMDGSIRRGRAEVGPVPLPVSEVSLALLEERLASVRAEHDVSFVGALYPYRVEMIEVLRASGVDVVVNPHREVVTRDFAESRTGQPGWLEFMAGLASGRMTINFSRSSAGPYTQMKWRVIEATLAGTLLLTDDRDRTERLFVPDMEFGTFYGTESLPGVIGAWLSEPERLECVRRAGQERARAIAPVGFLEGIDEVLRRRGLTALLPPRP